jgi:proline dehydrogenase
VNPLRSSLLWASHSQRLRHSIESFSSTRSVVERFVGGTTATEVVEAATALSEAGRRVTIDHLGEDVTDDAGAESTVEAYLELIPQLSAVAGADLSVKLSALGLVIDPAGAAKRARRIVEAASASRISVTIDMESSDHTDATLEIVSELRHVEASVGAVIQSMLRRSESDARELATAGARVRLCKGAYAEDRDVAFKGRADVNSSYFRCLRILWSSAATPLVASHDPVIIAYARDLAVREPRPFEFQMLFGVRPEEQAALVADQQQVRVYVPYGDEWYGYLMRRIAERPANLAFFARAVTSRR